MELAIYGKGGIGKSTVSANLTAALALSGERILQIGCDPKHDSTKLLMHGQAIPTVLDYLKDLPREAEDASAVLKEGFMGCGCIEAGGPKPGVGCAGRGIISAFEFLSRHHVKEAYDIVVYDVLGDVVCGGFAVPVRRQYADAVFLVTSGEFMAIYAANNILKGIYNFDKDLYARVGGIIFNERKLPGEEGRIRRFSEAVHLPVLAKIPRSSGFAKAEEAGVTLMELSGFDEEKQVFLSLADHIIKGPRLYKARPLEDAALEEAVLGTGTKKNAALFSSGSAFGDSSCCALQEDKKEADEKGPYEQKPRSNRPPLYGCAFNGAATCAVHLTDAMIIAHSPRECAFYTWQNISSSGRKNLFGRGILMPSAISPNFECTQMGHSEIVFGGMDTLRKQVENAKSRGYKAAVVISSCVSGIIGDDINDIESMGSLDFPVIAINADGDINGDYMEGMGMCMEILAKKLIVPCAAKKENCVNLINEAGVSNNRDLNFKTISSLLSRCGIGINCRFLGDATVSEMKNFCAAPLNILADGSALSLRIRAFLEKNFECCFLDEGFPVGFEATERFLRDIGSFFVCKEKVGRIIKDEKEKYEKSLSALKGALSGKKILMTTINSSLDWLIDAAEKAGAKFVWIGVLNYLHTPLCVSEKESAKEVVFEFSGEETVYEKINALKPDLVVSNYTTAVKAKGCATDALPMTPPAGFSSAVSVLERWAKLFEKKTDIREGGWKNDRVLFEKYDA